MESRIEQAIGQATSSGRGGDSSPITGLVNGGRHQELLRQKLFAALNDDIRDRLRELDELASSLGSAVDKNVDYAVNLASQRGVGLDIDTLDVLTLVAGHLHAIQVAVTEIKKSLR